MALACGLAAGAQAQPAPSQPPAELMAALSASRSQGCAGHAGVRTTAPKLTDIGLHRQGASYWIVLAAPFAPPPRSGAAAVSQTVLRLTNDARSHARRCGAASFAAAPAVKPNRLLDQAAAVQVRDMARHGALRHEGSDGSAPADRVSRAGYRWRSIAENIASGQPAPEEVVQDWINSPPHCANLMNPRFTEMGVAFAVDKDSPGGIYWAQIFGRPAGRPE